MRKAEVKRKTRETEIEISLDLDGQGKADVSTTVGFFTHMLESLSRHSLIDLKVNANGDTHVDFHHLVEDTGITLGKAIIQALGDKKGITRFASKEIPLDEALCRCVLDISGRPHLTTNLTEFSGKIGDFDFELVEVFFSGFASEGFTVHLDVLAGKNLHHIAESAFKSLAWALRLAVSLDPRIEGIIPSAKDFIEG